MTKNSIINSIRSLNNEASADENTAVAATPEPRSPARVPAGIIGATARTMSDIRRERDELRSQLEKAGNPREVDAALLDPSPFPDRLSDTNDSDFASLKKLIEEEGQKVAIQVREHPTAAGRYQIIYGHRRWRAAKELGRPVKIEIVSATDEQLAVAQGVENSARQDLTWIERALFAWRLESSGIKARSIRAALSVDDAELARFRSVCRALPSELIEQIGRAPRIGRPRWVELAGAVSNASSAVTKIRKTLSADKVATSPSDERFRAALASLLEPKVKAGRGVDLRTPGGASIGRLSVSKADLRITVEKQHSVAFATFLQAELPDLVARFLVSEGAEKP